jgi:SH3-like domain-containing protein
MRKALLAAPLAALSLVFVSFGAAADAPMLGDSSNLPVPRMVSLRSDMANGRHGPGVEHRIDWIYERPGLPMLVTGESGAWRRLRDPGGTEVWMHAQNLDPRRTVLVTGPQDAPLRGRPRENSRITAYLQPGVVGALTGCEGEWRRISVEGRVGWARQDTLWGASDCAGV